MELFRSAIGYVCLFLALLNLGMVWVNWRKVKALNYLLEQLGRQLEVETFNDDNQSRDPS